MEEPGATDGDEVPVEAAQSSAELLGASFRDPSGYVFQRDGVVYRQVNRCFSDDYDLLMSSGLYERLVAKHLLIPHQEVEVELEPAIPRDTPRLSVDRYRILRPEQLDFVSYPYEWCFSQLKDAALLTLRLQREALAKDMTLKDASVYNVQFQRGRPVMIDTLSFERYREGQPWVGYRQFCQHFLAPLALMSRRDVRLNQLLRSHLDGVPLDLARQLLPLRCWLNFGLLMHIRMHARYQQRYEASGDGDETSAKPRVRAVSKSALGNLIRALENTVKGLRWAPEGTEWAEYYSGDSYEAEALDHKKVVVRGFLDAIAPSRVWDLGANTGVYSRIAAEQGAAVVSFDVDPACVERNYLDVRKHKEERVLPLLLDLVNPSPAIGWANAERSSLAQRRHPDAILALALIHHVAISNNVPLPHIADFFAELAANLVIEFVPKSDAKVKVLLASREDIFPSYTREGFEAAFARAFEILETVEIPGSERTLYRMRRRE
jgi:ribosomal protein L11 methylase PrmA